jgi:hypothetical protein
MKTLFFAVFLALASGSSALAQVAAPIGTPPSPGANPTADLVLSAMMATARAASVNPQGAASASLNTNAAIQRYNMGDVNGARSAAIQALIQANSMPPNPIPILQSTIPQTSAMQTRPFPLPGGSIAAIDANAFVAQARGALANCQAVHSANTNAAAANVTAAERDERAGRYQNVRAEARTAVDLCAPATQQVQSPR